MRKVVMVALAVCLAAAGAERPLVRSAPAHERPGAPKEAPGKKDSEIEADIRARLARSKIASDGFQVHVQGGVATLDGRTDVVQHKGVATRMAKAAGAVAVNNRIQPTDAAREKANANLAKGRRRAQIKRGDARSTSAPPRQGR
jgi:hypothetical protein